MSKYTVFYREKQQCRKHGLTTWAYWSDPEASEDERGLLIPDRWDDCVKCEEEEYRKAEAEGYFYSVEGWIV